MELLIEALERDPARTRRRIGGALGLLVLMGLGGAVLESRFAGAPGETCSGAPARIAEVWSPDRQRAVHAAFLGSRQPYAEATWKAFERGVDRYRAAWAAMHTDACVATRVRGDQSEQLLDLRMACLEERRRELDAFVRVYEAPDPAALESAAAAVQRLSAIEACGDLASLRRGARPAPDLVTATRRAALRSQLAEAKALDHAYQWTPGLAIARGVVASARGVGDPALVADALLVEGDLLARSGDARAAEPVLYDAIAVADAGGADDLRVSAWIALMRVVGRDQAKLAQARVAASLARAVSDRLGASPQRSADLALALTPILLRAGEIDEAERTARDAVALEQRIGGADNLELGRALDYLASVELAKGHYPAAAELYARNLTIIEKSLGTDHPNAAAAYDNRGIAAWSAGRYDDALADHRRAIAIRERVLGPDHPDLAVSLCNAANALLSLGEPAQAARSYERAIAIFEHARGADHPTLASFRLNLGSAYAELGRTADARAQYQRALAIQLRALGPSHGDVGLTLAADAELFLDEHHDAEALAEYRRSLAIFEAALGREHPNVATALVGIGRSELGLGHRALATAALERAVAIDLASSIAPEITAEAQFALARALGGGARAMDLASAAARGFAHLGPAGHRQLVEVQQWLAAR
jgi:tetratricopeptide (TPR) repeat protein